MITTVFPRSINRCGETRNFKTRQRGIAFFRFGSVCKSPSLTRRVGIIPFVFAPLISDRIDQPNFKNLSRSRGTLAPRGSQFPAAHGLALSRATSWQHSEFEAHSGRVPAEIARNEELQRKERENLGDVTLGSQIRL